MATITVDTWDSPEVMRAAAAYLERLASLPSPMGVVHAAPVPEVSPTANTAGGEQVDDGQPSPEVQAPLAQAPEVAEAPGVLPQVDQHGVPFNAAYCGVSAEPFYQSGKTAGQWKKKRGLEEADYANWYAAELGRVQAQEPAPESPAPAASVVDVAAAFGGQPAATATPRTGPVTFNELVAWISEMQAAGRLVSSQVVESYAACGVTVGDMLDPAKAAEAVGAVYQHLANVAGV